MKNILNKISGVVLILSLATLCSCGHILGVKDSGSSENKAEKLAETEIKKRLNYDGAYEPVETKVDSAFTSIYTDKEACEAAIRILEMEKKLDRITDEYNSERSSVALWSGSNSEFSKEECRQAKERLSKCEKRLKKLEGERAEQESIIRDRYGKVKDGEYYGKAITHRFRCRCEFGDEQLTDALLISDDDYTQVKLFVILNDEKPYGYDLIKDVIESVIE